jgi:hypothetical protein
MVYGTQELELSRMERRGTAQDWRRGAQREARASCWRGTVTSGVLGLVLLLALHITVVFWEELESPANADKTRWAREWLRTYCVNPDLPPGIRTQCVDYQDWMSRSPNLNALRLALHRHVDYFERGWVWALGWVLTWDTFYSFQLKQVVNSICTSFAFVMPVLAVFALVYLALWLKGPLTELRYWQVFKHTARVHGESPQDHDHNHKHTHNHQCESTLDYYQSNQALDKNSKHQPHQHHQHHQPEPSRLGKAKLQVPEYMWSGVSPAEQTEMVQRLLQRLKARQL